MSKKIMQSLLAMGLVLGIAASMSQPAQAGGGGRVAAGVAVGTLVGLGIAGARAVPRYFRLSCHAGPRQCGWAGRTCSYDRWGDQVCHGGAWRCRRPNYCG